MPDASLPDYDWLLERAFGDGLLMPSEVTRYVGTRIARYREAAGLSQRDLARAIGVKQPTISNWESGERELTLANLVAVANVLQVPVAAFLPWRRADQEWVERMLRPED